MRKFALTSNGPYAGKSTLAKYLAEHYGFIRADHSLTIVQEYVNMMNEHDGQGLTVEEVYRDKERHRQGLQRYSMELGFSSPGRANYWHIKTLARDGCNVIQARCPGAKPIVCPDKNVVVDPFRGEVQGDALRSLGFELVQINITDVTRCDRARANGKTCGEVLAAMEAAPELELGIYRPDIVLLGEQPVEVLARTLMHRPEGAHGLQIFGSR